MSTPLMSYIVLSYNYEEYISTTIRSVLAQKVQDFEIIVVDDASSDQSREVVQSFDDPRIQLIVNEQNLGGAGSYNVAVRAARGEWLVNLDADDWITPDKSERQLAVAMQSPQADIIGTWVNVVAADGATHPEAPALEALINTDRDFNLVDSWINENSLCRSSTMVRRDAHLRVGLDDCNMVAAPDYELWTRALAAGCRFLMVKERLTFMRRQSRGVTHADPLRSFLESCYVLHRNVLPVAERRALWPSFAAILQWVTTNTELAALASRERDRLLGLFTVRGPLPDYAAFRAVLSAPDPELERVGHRALFLSSQVDRHGKESIIQLRATCNWLEGQRAAWELSCRDAVRAYEERGAYIDELRGASGVLR